jgi:hypothetical protein
MKAGPKRKKELTSYSEKHDRILRIAVHEIWKNSPTNFSKAVGEFMGI